MIHFTCDACRRRLDPDDDTRYVVRIEIYAALDDDAPQADEDDHLEEIEDLLERMDDLDSDEQDASLYRQVRYDLCPRCRERFLNDPLGVQASRRLGFSNN